MEEIMTATYSVVIPVYNAEKYLEEAIRSVWSQHTAAAVEIILVNDGSTDQSAQLCDRLAREHASIKVIHQVNQGVSAARNAGIGVATGQYVLFLDGDDYWDERLLQLLDQYLEQQPDIIEFGYQRFGTNENHMPVLPAVKTAGMTGMEYFETHKKLNVMPIASSCTAAFKRQLIEKGTIRFPSDLSYGEDFDFHMQCLKIAETVVSMPEVLYWYRMNQQSATHTLSVKKMRDMLLSCVKMYRNFPCQLFADYYCMKILSMEKLSRTDAAQLKGLLRENRDILRQVSGRKMSMIRTLYQFLGCYNASRLIRYLLNIRHHEGGN